MSNIYYDPIAPWIEKVQELDRDQRRMRERLVKVKEKSDAL